MHNWSLLLLFCLAIFQPIASFTERSLVNGRDKSCDLEDKLVYGHPCKTQERYLNRLSQDQRNEVRRSSTGRLAIDRRIAAAPQKDVTSSRQGKTLERSDIRRENEITENFLANRRENRIYITKEKQDRDRDSIRITEDKGNRFQRIRVIQNANRNQEILEQRFTRNTVRRSLQNDVPREERSGEVTQKHFVRINIRQDGKGGRRVSKRSRHSMDSTRATVRDHRDAEERERIQKTRQIRGVFQRTRDDITQRSASDRIRGRDFRSFEFSHEERRVLKQRKHRETMLSRPAANRASNGRDEVQRSSNSLRVVRDESRRSISRVQNAREDSVKRAYDSVMDESRRSMDDIRKGTHSLRLRSFADRVRDAKDETRRSLKKFRNGVSLSRPTIERVRDARETRKSLQLARNVRNVARSRPTIDQVRVSSDEVQKLVERHQNSRAVARDEIRRSLKGDEIPAVGRVRISRDLSRRSTEQDFRFRSATERDSRDNSQRSRQQTRNVRDAILLRPTVDQVRSATDNSRRSLEQARNVRDTVQSRPAADRFRDIRVDSRRFREQTRIVKDQSRSAVDQVRNARDESRKSLEQARKVRDLTRSKLDVNRVRISGEETRRFQVRSVRSESRRMIDGIRNNFRDETRVLTIQARPATDLVRGANNHREPRATVYMTTKGIQPGDKAPRDRTTTIRRETMGERQISLESQRVINTKERESPNQIRNIGEGIRNIRVQERVMEQSERELHFAVRHAKERQHLDVTREMKVSPIRVDYRFDKHLERNIDFRYPVNTKNREVYTLIKEKEDPQQKSATFNWHYILFTLQGIYLSGVLTQLLNLGSEKKMFRACWWAPNIEKFSKVD